MKNVAVETVALINDKVQIEYYLPEWDECKTLDVSAAKYEEHLTDIAALDWGFAVMQGNEYTDDKTGTMSLAEYFADIDIQQKNKDAVSYIICNETNHDGIFDMPKMVADVFGKFVS